MPFAAVCATVFLVWGALDASEQLTALYLQDVRGKSGLTASLYFLPAPVCGALMNVATGFLLLHVRPSFAVPTACLISGVTPLLFSNPMPRRWVGYRHTVFQAMVLNPLGADMIYTIANLVVTDAFPMKTQALARGIFNILAQIGKSAGLTTTAIAARQVAVLAEQPDPKEALLQGY